MNRRDFIKDVAIGGAVVGTCLPLTLTNEEKLNRGFVALRNKEIARKSKHPNTFTCIVTAKKTDKGILQYIETECGCGEKLFASIKESNDRIETAKAAFIEKGGWKIEDFYD